MLSFENVSNFALNFFVLIFFAIIYSYMYHLERIGCECAVHPYQDIIKIFTLYAFVFVILVTLVPTAVIAQNFGNTATILYVIVKLLFYISCIIYFYMILEYTRFLVNEKCKCSNDIRREIITAGAILEIIIMLFALLIVIIIPIVFGSLVYISRNYQKLEKELSSSMSSPLRAASKIPSKISSESKAINKTSKLFDKLSSVKSRKTSKK